MIVLIINGAPEVGKDTFIKLLNETTKQEVKAMSIIDWVKDKAKNAGWDGIKNAKGRQLLSDLEDALKKYDDLPIKKLINKLDTYKKFPDVAPGYFCINIRKPSEILKMKTWCNTEKIPCFTVWVRQIAAEKKALDNAFLSLGDTQFAEFTYDWVIDNNRTKVAFKKQIKKDMETLGIFK